MYNFIHYISKLHLKLSNPHSRIWLILIQLTFTNKIVNIWNSLPNAVVDVNSVDAFKSRLDNFWKLQDVKFDYIADLTGTGDRSEFDI